MSKPLTLKKSPVSSSTSTGKTKAPVRGFNRSNHHVKPKAATDQDDGGGRSYAGAKTGTGSRTGARTGAGAGSRSGSAGSGYKSARPEGRSDRARGGEGFGSRDGRDVRDGRPGTTGRASGGRSEFSRSDSGRPNSSRSDSSRSDSSRSDSPRSDSPRSNSSRPDSRRSDTPRAPGGAWSNAQKSSTRSGSGAGTGDANPWGGGEGGDRRDRNDQNSDFRRDAKPRFDRPRGAGAGAGTRSESRSKSAAPTQTLANPWPTQPKGGRARDEVNEGVAPTTKVASNASSEASPWAKSTPPQKEKSLERNNTRDIDWDDDDDDPEDLEAFKAMMQSQSGTRISKYLSEQGKCSRREADEYIQRGWVRVNGKIAQLGQRMQEGDEVTLDEIAQTTQANLVTILLHKPVGFVSSQPEDGYEAAVSLINAQTQYLKHDHPFAKAPKFSPDQLYGLAPAGRLDIDSTGLLVLTQDGRIAKQLIGENSLMEKEYLVRVQGQLTEEGLKLLNHGLIMDGEKLKPAKVKRINDDQLHFILKQGKKRQIRRMCEMVGLEVVGLKRVRIGRVKLGELPMGQWRYLLPFEKF